MFTQKKSTPTWNYPFVPVVKTTKLNLSDPSGADPRALEPCDIEFSKFAREEHVVMGCYGKRFNRLFQIVGDYKGELIDRMVAGVEYSAVKTKIEVVKGDSWGGVSIPVAPAYAPVALTQVEHTSIQAYNALQAFFGTSGQPYNLEFSGNLRALSQLDVNAFRLLVRGIVCYFYSKNGEKRGKPVAYTTASSPVDIRMLNSFIDFQRFTTEAVAGANFVPYIARFTLPASSDLSDVLFTILGDELLIDGVKPYLWPDLGDVKFLYQGGRRNINVRARMSSAEIWALMVQWAHMYANLKLLHEAFNFVAFTFFEPRTDVNFFLATRSSVQMPQFQTNSLVLAPIMTVVQSVQIDDWAKLHAIMIDGILQVREILYVLWHRRFVGQWLPLHLISKLVPEHYAIELTMQQSTIGSTMAWNLVQNWMPQVGLSGHLGRLLSTWQPVLAGNLLNYDVRLYLGNYANGHSWIDLVQILQALPAECSVLGQLYPLRAERSAPIKKPCSVEQIDRLNAPYDGLAGLADTGVVYSYKFHDSNDCTTMARKVILRDIRQRLLDYQFVPVQTYEEMTVDLVITIPDEKTWFLATSTEHRRLHTNWYVERWQQTVVPVNFATIPIGTLPNTGPAPTPNTYTPATHLPSGSDFGSYQGGGGGGQSGGGGDDGGFGGDSRKQNETTASAEFNFIFGKDATGKPKIAAQALSSVSVDNGTRARLEALPGEYVVELSQQDYQALCVAFGRDLINAVWPGLDNFIAQRDASRIEREKKTHMSRFIDVSRRELSVENFDFSADKGLDRRLAQLHDSLEASAQRYDFASADLINTLKASGAVDDTHLEQAAALLSMKEADVDTVANLEVAGLTYKISDIDHIIARTFPVGFVEWLVNEANATEQKVDRISLLKHSGKPSLLWTAAAVAAVDSNFFTDDDAGLAGVDAQRAQIIKTVLSGGNRMLLDGMLSLESSGLDAAIEAVIVGEALAVAADCYKLITGNGEYIEVDPFADRLKAITAAKKTMPAANFPAIASANMLTEAGSIEYGKKLKDYLLTNPVYKQLFKDKYPVFVKRVNSTAWITNWQLRSSMRRAVAPKISEKSAVEKPDMFMRNVAIAQERHLKSKNVAFTQNDEARHGMCLLHKAALAGEGLVPYPLLEEIVASGVAAPAVMHGIGNSFNDFDVVGLLTRVPMEKRYDYCTTWAAWGKRMLETAVSLNERVLLAGMVMRVNKARKAMAISPELTQEELAKRGVVETLPPNLNARIDLGLPAVDALIMAPGKQERINLHARASAKEQQNELIKDIRGLIENIETIKEFNLTKKEKSELEQSSAALSHLLRTDDLAAAAELYAATGETVSNLLLRITGRETADKTTRKKTSSDKDSASWQKKNSESGSSMSFADVAKKGDTRKGDDWKTDDDDHDFPALNSKLAKQQDLVELAKNSHGSKLGQLGSATQPGTVTAQQDLGVFLEDTVFDVLVAQTSQKQEDSINSPDETAYISSMHWKGVGAVVPSGLTEEWGEFLRWASLVVSDNQSEWGNGILREFYQDMDRNFINVVVTSPQLMDVIRSKYKMLKQEPLSQRATERDIEDSARERLSTAIYAGLNAVLPYGLVPSGVVSAWCGTIKLPRTEKDFRNQVQHVLSKLMSEPLGPRFLVRKIASRLNALENGEGERRYLALANATKLTSQAVATEWEWLATRADALAKKTNLHLDVLYPTKPITSVRNLRPCKLSKGFGLLFRTKTGTLTGQQSSSTTSGGQVNVPATSQPKKSADNKSQTPKETQAQKMERVRQEALEELFSMQEETRMSAEEFKKAKQARDGQELSLHSSDSESEQQLHSKMVPLIKQLDIEAGRELDMDQASADEIAQLEKHRAEAVVMRARYLKELELLRRKRKEAQKKIAQPFLVSTAKVEKPVAAPLPVLPAPRVMNAPPETKLEEGAQSTSTSGQGSSQKPQGPSVIRLGEA